MPVHRLEEPAKTRHSSVEEELRHSLSQLPIEMLLPLIAEFKPETAPGVQALSLKGLDERLVISLLCEQNASFPVQPVHSSGARACQQHARTPLDLRTFLNADPRGSQSCGIDENSIVCCSATDAPCHLPETQIGEKHHESVVPKESDFPPKPGQLSYRETPSTVKSLLLTTEAPAGGMRCSMRDPTAPPPTPGNEKQELSDNLGDPSSAESSCWTSSHQNRLSPPLTGLASKSLGNGTVQKAHEDRMCYEVRKRRTIPATPCRISRACQISLGAEQLKKVMLSVKCYGTDRKKMQPKISGQASIKSKNGRPKGKILATKARACDSVLKNKTTEAVVRKYGVPNAAATLCVPPTRRLGDNVPIETEQLDARCCAINRSRRNTIRDGRKGCSVKQSRGWIRKVQSKAGVNRQPTRAATRTEVVAPSCTSVHCHEKRKNHSTKTVLVKKARTTELGDSAPKQTLKKSTRKADCSSGALKTTQGKRRVRPPKSRRRPSRFQSKTEPHITTNMKATAFHESLFGEKTLLRSRLANMLNELKLDADMSLSNGKARKYG
ncbi:hypothetical protein TGME49_203090 [Toxoplasma gondii ME49]|uniref:Uncharacterized protein n=1 Tax=Toxoplasma gondii (strain ATCC 50611 / Me49) TaxID=508771 RepID=S8F956_TOXGM|nr:hypothetical protein TGME49_203090 [Toxoplasma gondii ME49]EPT30158.1 hypothetical protein TGME49_203090 [Toxoplasma gondii ME49]|eukprot:XP_018637371.1 hypothetical protein TGME49_203090 [Toxoplasma gondii ME49]